MPENKKINTKTKNDKKFNIGIIIFVVIFAYLMVYLGRYCIKDRISIYEVKQNKIVDSISLVGVISRSETIISSKKSGYINYYFSEGDRVKKGATIYTIDETGAVYNTIAEKTSENAIFTANDYNDIKTKISNFVNSFDETNYYKVYDFKYKLEDSIFELSNKVMNEEIEQILNIEKSSLKKGNSKTSGIISYYYDGYENLSEDNITKDIFDKSNYSRIPMKYSEKIEEESPIYKIIDDDSWCIYVMLSDGEYERLKDISNINIKFLEDNFETNTDVKLFQKETKDGKIENYAKLSFERFMDKYLNDRFVNIELLINVYEGYKIPNSSITTKEFYKVPLKYLIDGNKFIRRTIKDNGRSKEEDVTPTIYKKDETYCYLDPNEIDSWENFVFIDKDSEDTYKVELTSTFEGVYSVNKGYTIFRLITRIYSNNEYTIVKVNQKYGLSNFDHIILNSNTITENKVIY